MAGVLYTEKNHLHRQWWEFCIRNNAQKTKEKDVKTLLFSLAYLTLIKLPYCRSTGKRDFIKNQNWSETILQSSKWWRVVIFFYKIEDLYLSLHIEMGSTGFFFFFFFLPFLSFDCKMVSDRFWMIYSITENPRPTGKCVKYTPRRLGVKEVCLVWGWFFWLPLPESIGKILICIVLFYDTWIQVKRSYKFWFHPFSSNKSGGTEEEESCMLSLSKVC